MPSAWRKAWYQRQAPDGEVTCRAALEGWELKPDAEAEIEPESADRESSTSGRGIAIEDDVAEKLGAPSSSHHTITSTESNSFPRDESLMLPSQFDPSFAA